MLLLSFIADYKLSDRIIKKLPSMCINVVLVAQRSVGYLEQVNNILCFEQFNILTCFTVTVSKPELTLVPSANEATVRCGVHSSSPALKMEFLDDEGKVLPSAEPKFHLGDTGLVSVTLEMLVPDNITRLEFPLELESASFLNVGQFKGQLTKKSDFFKIMRKCVIYIITEQMFSDLTSESTAESHKQGSTTPGSLKHSLYQVTTISPYS